MKRPQPQTIIYPNKYGFLPSPGDYCLFKAQPYNVVVWFYWSQMCCEITFGKIIFVIWKNSNRSSDCIEDF